MADNNRTYGYRAKDPAGRAPSSGPAAKSPADPLAELARLIGQQNESSPVAPPSPSRVASPVIAPRAAVAKGYEQGDSSADGWSHPPQQPCDSYDAYSPQGYSDPYSKPEYPEPQSNARYGDSRYSQPGYEATPRYADPQPSPNSYSPGYPDPHYSEPQSHAAYYRDPQASDPYFDSSAPNYGAQGAYEDPQGYSDPRYSGAAYTSAAHAGSAYAGSAYDTQGYGSQTPYAQDDPAFANMPSFARPAGQQGYSDSFYSNNPPSSLHRPVADDHGPSRRRGSMVTVLAVLALAVVGTAAAFGYRAMFGTAGTAVRPPIIRADPRPSKVIPVANDPNGKPIQDRIGGDSERVVSREETPVDPSRGANPRVIFPNLSEQGQKPGGPAVAANVGSTGSAPANGSEPKRIRTVAIKPEQPGAAAAAGRNSPVADPQSNAPLALAPNAQPAAPTRQQPAPQQQASRPATSGSASPFPAPISSGNPIAGGYAVQVLSLIHI